MNVKFQYRTGNIVAFFPAIFWWTIFYRHHKTRIFTGSAPSSFLQSLLLTPHWNRWRFMQGTIRTIQRKAGQALPTCTQPNHNLMNTLGAVCSKLLPVGARATGNPLCHLTLAFSTPSLQSPCPPASADTPVLRFSTRTLNQIKIHISVLSAFQHSSECLSIQQQAYKLHVGTYRLTTGVLF